jgi:hypothetical protein
MSRKTKEKMKTKIKKKPIVVVRTYSAGVHVGTLESQKGTEVVLSGAVRIWRWAEANTLSELSQKGAGEKYTRISEAVPEITLTQATEVIPCSLLAAENLLRSRWSE